MATNKLRTQSGLGSDFIKKTKRDNKVGSLVIAKVKKVYYQEQTVELLVVNENTSVGNNFSSTGELSAPYPKSFSGVTPENDIYGDIPIITPGMIVLVGFLNGDVSSPIIVNNYGTREHNKRLARTPMISGDNRDTNQFKYNTAKFNLYPSLNLDYIDGEGDIVKTWNGNTFMSVTSDSFNQESATDYMYGTKYEDLDVTKYADGVLIEPRVKNSPNMLVKHQGYVDINGIADNHVTMFYLDSDGTFRHSILNEEEQFRTYTELSSNGDYKVRLQEDSVIVDEGQDYLEFGIERETQIFYIVNAHHKFEFRDEGIYIDGYPMLDNIDKDIEKAFKKLNELREYIDKIEDILSGLGERDLRELINDTNTAIALAEDTAAKLKTTNTNLDKVSGRLEGAITKYDDMLDKVQQSYKDLSGGIDNLRADVRTNEQDIRAINTEMQGQVFRDLNILELTTNKKGFVIGGLGTPEQTNTSGWFNMQVQEGKKRIVYTPDNEYQEYININTNGEWQGWEKVGLGDEDSTSLDSIIVVSREEPEEAILWFEVTD